MRSPTFSSNISETNSGERYLSAYGDRLTKEGILKYTKTIRDAFPELPSGFYDVLAERIKEKGFTDRRLADAVGHVVDTCIYPRPTIANFIGYDRQIRLYTYQEMLARGPEAWSTHRPLQLPDQEKLLWVHTDDIKKFNLKQYEK
ncbi:MAG: hypothetical protein WC261_10320 [Synergistaceae bacterium]